MDSLLEFNNLKNRSETVNEKRAIRRLMLREKTSEAGSV